MSLPIKGAAQLRLAKITSAYEGATVRSMTLAIAHRNNDGGIVLDVVRERKPPFSPEDVVLEFAALLKTYRVRTISGDRYGGEWPRPALLPSDHARIT